MDRGWVEFPLGGEAELELGEDVSGPVPAGREVGLPADADAIAACSTAPSQSVWHRVRGI